MNKKSSYIWGVLLIVIGVIWALNALDITDISLFFDGWWTLFIIVPCVLDLFKKGTDKFGDLIGIIIGLLLLGCYYFWTFSMLIKLIVPVILVLVGIRMLCRNAFSSKVSKKIQTLNKEQEEKEEQCATFGESKTNYNGKEFKGADVTAVFGGATCDLRSAVIPEDAVINATAIFGGVDIFVPDTVNVCVKSFGLFGGVDNKKQNVDIVNGATIYVNAVSLFGGVDVK